jgi:hypothetical protein
MAFVIPTYVKKMQSEKNAEFWRLYNNTGKELINECMTHIGLSASIDMLEDALQNCSGASSVLVKLYTVKPERTLSGQSKGDTYELRVKLDGENNSGNFTQRSFNPSMGAPTWVDMMQMSDRIRQTELDKLRLELEQKDESPWTAIANKLLENDALILAIAGLIKKPIAQTTRQISAPQNENDLFNRLNNIGFSNTDIENMATYLEENPGVIDQIKPIFAK